MRALRTSGLCSPGVCNSEVVTVGISHLLLLQNSELHCHIAKLLNQLEEREGERLELESALTNTEQQWQTALKENEYQWQAGLEEKERQWEEVQTSLQSQYNAMYIYACEPAAFLSLGLGSDPGGGLHKPLLGATV